MADVKQVVTPERYSQGLTYEGFLSQIAANRERFQESDAAFQLSPADAQFFRDMVRRQGPLKVLALAVDWSPECHRYLPVMAKIAQDSGMELRIFPRDENPDIMNLYLNKGKFMSVPVLAFFDEDWKPLCHWTERPAGATAFRNEVGAELAAKNLTPEERRSEMRGRSAPLVDGWRAEAVRELKELLS